MSYFARKSINKSYHDKVLRDIAKIRFDEIKYDVITNPSEEKKGWVFGPGDEKLYPDIIVLEKGYGRRNAIFIGEIETSDTINENEAEQWEKYANTKIPFYLYVPSGYVKATTDILMEKNIIISGLRTYRYIKTGQLVITNIY